MCMAAQIEDRTNNMEYLSTCLQQFLMECGRTHAILNNTVIQSDQEDFLIALLKMTAATFGGNLAVRQAPAYTSQAQGSVERFHRTLMGQVRALKLQLENNYRIHLTSKHSHHAMDGETRSIPPEQVRRTLRRQHQLLQAMEQGAQNKVLSSSLDGKGHSNKRKHPRHLRQGR